MEKEIERISRGRWNERLRDRKTKIYIKRERKGTQGESETEKMDIEKERKIVREGGRKR